MSAIPPNRLASIIQTHAAQNRASEARTREEAESVERTHEAVGTDTPTNVIDNDDRDSSVYADAEGAGSQGRPFSQPSEERAPEDEGNKDSGEFGALDGAVLKLD